MQACKTVVFYALVDSQLDVLFRNLNRLSEDEQKIRPQHAGDGRRRARVLRRADQDAPQVPTALVGVELESEFAAKRQPLSRLPAANAEGRRDFTMDSTICYIKPFD